MQFKVVTSLSAPLSLAVAMALGVGGCSTETLPEGAAVTKDDGRVMNGKSDRDGDICEDLGWYGDGECDEFCPVYDEADCEAECVVDADCPTIFCIRAPCPFTVCVAGQCLVDVSGDDCPAGERECDICDGETLCTDQREACAIDSCPPEAAPCGSRGLGPCPDDQFCDWEISALCGGFDRPGVCRPIPMDCTAEAAPVCGCDLVTYDSECAANAAGVSVSALGGCA